MQVSDKGLVNNNKATSKVDKRQPALKVNEIINNFLDAIMNQVPKKETPGLLYALRVKNITADKHSYVMPILINQFAYGRTERVKIYPFLRGFSVSHTGTEPIMVNIGFVLPNMINLEARNDFLRLLENIETEGGYLNYIMALKVDDLIMLGYILNTRVGQGEDISSAEGSLQMICSSFAIPQPAESAKTVYEFTFKDPTDV